MVKGAVVLSVFWPTVLHVFNLSALTELAEPECGQDTIDWAQLPLSRRKTSCGEVKSSWKSSSLCGKDVILAATPRELLMSLKLSPDTNLGKNKSIKLGKRGKKSSTRSVWSPLMEQSSARSLVQSSMVRAMACRRTASFVYWYRVPLREQRVPPLKTFSLWFFLFYLPLKKVSLTVDFLVFAIVPLNK